MLEGLGDLDQAGHTGGVVVGAHYDHVGYGNASNSYGPTGYIHNGADDNASGVAGLIEIAEAFQH
ncbi:MAG: M28 family peptidase, partial [Planctomycetia bacterium]